KGIAGAEADIYLLAGLLAELLSGLLVILPVNDSGSQVLDHRSRSIDLEAGADTLGVERLSGRMRGRIGGDDLHGVAAVWQKTGVERIVAIGEVALQQQPARFAVATVVDGVDELVVVVVMGRPADANRVAVAHGRRRRLKARLSGCGRLGSIAARSRLVAVSRLNRDVVNFGRNIFGQVVQQDIVNPRSGTAGSQIGGMKHDL